MQTRELIAKLVGVHHATLLSDIVAAPFGDIDLYVPPDFFPQAIKCVEDEGYTITHKDPCSAVYSRFENGTMYMVDLLCDFNVYARAGPSLRLSPKGSASLVQSVVLNSCFKGLCLNRRAKIPFIQTHWAEFKSFLMDGDNFESHQVLSAGSKNETAKGFFNHMARASFCKRLIASLRYRWSVLGTGVSLAFIGPDGSGKSFIIDKLRPIGPTSFVYMGDWFFAFQRLYTLLLKIPSPWNRFLYGIYFIENLIRYGKVLLLRFLGHIVLIDRFPGTNRNVIHKGLLQKINKAVFAFFPKPDLLVLLEASPDVVYKRKQELSVQEIAQIQEALRVMLKGERHVVLNTEALDETLNSLLAAAYACRDVKKKKSV
jgi:hypothetical protein